MTVSDRDTLHSAILDDPSDDTTRLVLADMLRESDDPDALARGRLLWAGVTASQFRSHDVIDDPAYSPQRGRSRQSPRRGMGERDALNSRLAARADR
jgi:uncharacterized protein (TIGR02996 family)